MKKLVFLVSFLFITSSYSQIITLISEDFTGTVMPANWNQHEFGTGTQAWTFGSAVMPGNATYNVANFPNNAAIFNDDAAGNTGLRNKRTIETPFMDALSGGLYEGADVLVRYHYALNNKGADGDNHFEDNIKIRIVDTAGDSSPYLAVHYGSNDPQYNTINLKQTFLDYPNVNPGNFKVLWEFDDVDSSWGWGAGIDDVKVSIQPLNDACQNAIVIPPSLPYNRAQNAIGSTNNNGFINTSGCGSGMNDGVWYTFTPTASGQINITASANVSPNWDLEIGVYTGTCGNFTCVASVDAYGSGTPETISYLSVTAGTQYFINIGYYSGVTDLPEHKFILMIDGNLSTSENSIIGFEMYPNPVKDILSLSAENSIDKISIHNVLGQEVLTLTPKKTQIEINTKNLETGVYIIKVQAGNQTGSYQLIKE